MSDHKVLTYTTWQKAGWSEDSLTGHGNCLCHVCHCRQRHAGICCPLMYTPEDIKLTRPHCTNDQYWVKALICISNSKFAVFETRQLNEAAAYCVPFESQCLIEKVPWAWETCILCDRQLLWGTCAPLDDASGFHQILLRDEDRPKTAFNKPVGRLPIISTAIWLNKCTSNISGSHE